MKNAVKQLRRCLRWPWWLLSPASKAHDFRGNPVLGSPLLNRLGLHVFRLVLAHAITRLRWWALRPLMRPHDRAAFHRDGYLLIDAPLSAAEFALLSQELAGVRGEARECIQGDTLTQRMLLDDATLAELPVTRRLLADPLVSGPMRYAGTKNCRPRFYLQSIRNGAREALPDPQKNLHSDTFHPTMKAWLFLDDVGASSGPFTYVPGSHRLSWSRIRWEYRRSLVAATLDDGYSAKGSFRFDASDLERLGLPAPRVFELPANTLVIANTFGIHCRGQALAGSKRREIWAYSRFNPFNPWPGLGLGLYNRVDLALVKRWWRHLDREAARHGQLSSWHPVSAETFHAD